MQFPNTDQINLILDIILDLLLDCYILWNMKILLMLKFCIAIKKILNILDVNLMDYLFSENALLIEYTKRKLFALRKYNAIMKKCVKNKSNIKALSPNLTLELSIEVKNKKIYERELMENDNKKENADESVNLKI